MITFAELKKKASELYPAMTLEQYSRHSWRKKVNTILFYLLILSFIVMMVSIIVNHWGINLNRYIVTLGEMTYSLRGLFFMIFSMWLFSSVLEAFYFSYYFAQSEIDFDVAKLIILSPCVDLTADFLQSNIGEYTMMRLGIDKERIHEFINEKKNILHDRDFDLEVDRDTPYVSIKEYGRGLYRNDPEFVTFLEKNMIQENIFLGALNWVDHNQWRIRNEERWWTKDNLLRIPSIGSNWSFGQVYLLEKFGHSIMIESSYKNLGDKWRIHKEDVNKIEQVLVRNKGANVMLISPTSDIGMETVSSLAKMILNGTTLQPLEKKRIFVLDGLSVWDGSGSEQVDFEKNFIEILSQANRAGNVILVIPRLAEFIEKAHSSDINVAALLSDFLSSSRIQLIALTDRNGYHETIETDYDLMQNFEKIQIQDINSEVALRILQDEAIYLEKKYDIFFTYQAIFAIVEGTERYFVGSIYGDKIVDLLEGVATMVKSDKRKVVTIDDVNTLITQKTGVPQGKMDSEERTKLGSLEETLHKRIVGQNEAIASISDAMRRARAGIANPKRPIGSFLFLGPTGVGKTETTKALAESFFGNEEQIIRLDMSEYSGDDAVEKLIGSFDTKAVGVLARKLRTQQYGVLLLDELEKTNPEVMDLFLQIIDEGKFTDARGEVINTRNLIIVATTNAGSDLIYEKIVSGDENSLKGAKSEIIDQVISRQIFKPELLNRFDGIILFHPLSKEHLEKIAKLMLAKLNQRISQKGISVDLSPDLVSYLVKIGSNPRFGARAMNRAIQDEVEKRIANEIIAGRLHGGSIASFVIEDGSLKICSRGKV